MKNAYTRLQQHLDRQPVGFPPSRNGADVRLLEHIFTPEEARIACCLSHEPEPVETIFDRARGLVPDPAELTRRLDTMVKKGGLEFRRTNGRELYANAPLVVGMYELQVNRLTPDFIRDFKAYSSETRFGISFLATGRSQMRTVPVHMSITPSLPVADYNRVHHLLDTADAPFVVLPCICRKKKAMLGTPCARTDRTETCMAMGGIAQTLIKMGLGREIPRSEARTIVRLNQKEGLVLQPANTRKIEFLCSCCSCCCSMLGLQKDLPLPLDFWEAGFTAALDRDRCVACGRCADTCSTDALVLPSPSRSDRSKPKLDARRCIGCGQCVAACRANAITLAPRMDQAPPPSDRHALNAELLQKKTPLAPVRTIGKLARGIALTRDLRLLRGSDD